MKLFDFGKNPTSVIAIDVIYKTVHFYSLDGKGAGVRHQSESFKEMPFGEDFFTKFDTILKTHREKNPTDALQSVTLVLPDSAIITDTISVPTLKSTAAKQKSLNLALESLFINPQDFEFKSFVGAENRQFTSYAVVGVKKELLARLKSICAVNKITVKCVTYASAARINAALALNSELKGKSFLLFDMKEDSSTLAFAVKGKAFGFYSLPYGYSVLSESEEIKEKTLFKHSAARAALLEAEKRAKARLAAGISMPKPTAEDKADAEGASENETAPVAEAALQSDGAATVSDTVPPLFPESVEPDLPDIPEEVDVTDYLAKNTDIIVKWAESIIADNVSIVSLGAPEYVVLGIPGEYGRVVEIISADADVHRKYQPVATAAMREITDNLDVYGGLFVRLQGNMNNF